MSHVRNILSKVHTIGFFYVALIAYIFGSQLLPKTAREIVALCFACGLTVWVVHSRLRSGEPSVWNLMLGVIALSTVAYSAAVLASAPSAVVNDIIYFLYVAFAAFFIVGMKQSHKLLRSSKQLRQP